MLDHLTAPQLAEWRAYDRIEPIGGYREDYRAAQVCLMLHTLIQSNRGDGKWTKASIYDFMPWGPEDPGRQAADKPQSVDEMKTVLLGIARSSKVKKP